MPEPTPGDAIDLLLAQHARIEEQFVIVLATTGPTRREAFDRLVRLLAMHETAEEQVIHPLSRVMADSGDAMVDDRLAEERRAKQMLLDLMDDGVNAEAFEDRLMALREAVLTHARYEERYEFPLLRLKVPSTQLRAAATAVRAAEGMAPTRPHPGIESAKGNLLLGPPLAIIDHVRDAFRNARRDTD